MGGGSVQTRLSFLMGKGAAWLRGEGHGRGTDA